MIKQLQLRNFKCFADQTIQFAPLTLLVGANASGKSSVIQALLLLHQSDTAQMLESGSLLLRGDLTNVGTQAEVVYRGERDDNRIEIVVTDKHGRESFSFEFDVNQASDYTIKGPPHELLTSELLRKSNLFASTFNYLNAERIGPRLLYPIGSDDRWAFDVGTLGQFVAAILGRFGAQTIDSALSGGDEVEAQSTEVTSDPDAPIELTENGTPQAAEQPTPTTLFRPLEDEVKRWMQEIVPGFDFEARIVEQTDQAIIQMRTNPVQSLVRPTNIGFGLIYTLPIVVAALVAPKGSLLIVENPEAHLHPRGQSAIGKFLARVASAGVQVIVETHSDHVLNGIRVAVREGAWGKKLDADEVSIQYFMAADSEGPQRVRTPKMYPNGGIRPWPKGFFDQYESDLRKLL